MIITFCGHGDFIKKDKYELKLLSFLEEKIGDQHAELYLGGYGNFDRFAWECGKWLKEKNKNLSLVFVTPYLSAKYQKNHFDDQRMRYDSIIYPEIEDKPPRFAILYRNRYMIEKADYVIAYVDHKWGGAYQSYQYAKRKRKTILNLADFDLS